MNAAAAVERRVILINGYSGLSLGNRQPRNRLIVVFNLVRDESVRGLFFMHFSRIFHYCNIVFHNVKFRVAAHQNSISCRDNRF
jgi:hypothetical protein